MRREIVAMDELGLNVDRYTLRATEDELVDPTDIAEREKTRAVLGVGKLGLLKAMAGNLIARPSAFFRALAQAIRMGRRSERGTLLHLIYLAEACVLRGWLVERGTTHLHCHYGTNSATVALLCRILGGPPYSFTMHGPGGVRLAPGPLAPRQDPPRRVRGRRSANSPGASSSAGPTTPTGPRSTSSTAGSTRRSSGPSGPRSRTSPGWSTSGGWPSRRARCS